MTTPHELALLRLAAQRLAAPGPATPAEAVRLLTAVQAQDYAGALTSIALRTAEGTRGAVEAALDAGEIVRSWPMRGTLHVVAAEDLPWMLETMTPRIIAATRARHAELGLDASSFEEARTLAVDALSGGRRLRRDDLMAVWDAGGLATKGQRGYHMLGHLAQTGVLCLGPVHENEQLIVLTEEWIPAPRRPEREEALGELALRYFRGHGPATLKDFARWTNLLMADARTGLALALPRLARLESGGAEYFMDPAAPELLDSCRSRARGVFLLPGFDEFMLGYGDRGAALPAEFAGRIVPGGNGVFRPTVVSDGRVVGTWNHTGRGARRTLAAAPFTAFSDEVAEELPRLYAALP
ncbi:winged helix DNA-binding domain-containing protein [Planomonospora venezuelensis]|uniref:Winged helix DNA-binding domain-containing protein n=1 Tax=Planomonospora venezuelensis TaxID=1999 RepID=A0A841DDN8_PLAVE|nr:winged helix DNA-binding domain-containing protein [Planomonospora venezuelensis]MBB5966977.1 hypothetical protein [Planomonospora venezuelensis]GIN01554.1 hypothetical protein Pve01_32120 [Planomonospora venezuelensis]